MKIAFSFFLLIYSRCGAPASWAARHTIVCLDTVEVNFNKSSYEVREDGDEVMIMIVLNQPSSKPFDVMISLMDVTTTGICAMYIELIELNSISI